MIRFAKVTLIRWNDENGKMRILGNQGPERSWESRSQKIIIIGFRWEGGKRESYDHREQGPIRAHGSDGGKVFLKT